MKLNDKTYEILKWVAIIVIPALGVAYQALAATWALPYGDEILKTTQIITALLGAILGISTIQYNKNNTEIK